MTTWQYLHLTSPEQTNASVHAQGGAPEQVSYAQKLLQHNRFGVFLKGGDAAVDGVYGILSGQAVWRAKYWLGYPDRDINHIFGPTLLRFLQGDALPMSYRIRRAARLRAYNKKKNETPKRIKAVNLAMANLGVGESPPGSNNNKFTQWYGLGPAEWCAEFLSWCGHYAGWWQFEPKTRYSYVPFIYSDAHAGRNGLMLTNDPVKGDIVIFHWPGGNPMGDHTGRFLEWTGEAPGQFRSIEGNTSTNNVAIEVRETGQVVAFVRVAS